MFSACCFDAEYSRDRQLPAVVQVENRTDGAIDLSRFASSPAAETAFIFGDRTIEAGEKLDLRVTEATFRSIVTGDFVFEGRCGDVRDWTRGGRTLTRESADGLLEVTVAIEDCTSAR